MLSDYDDILGVFSSQEVGAVFGSISVDLIHVVGVYSAKDYPACARDKLRMDVDGKGNQFYSCRWFDYGSIFCRNFVSIYSFRRADAEFGRIDAAIYRADD